MPAAKDRIAMKLEHRFRVVGADRLGEIDHTGTRPPFGVLDRVDMRLVAGPIRWRWTARLAAAWHQFQSATFDALARRAFSLRR